MDDLKGTASYVPDELNRAPNSKPKVTDGTSGSPEWDVIMIGAGMSGIYTNYRMLQLGLKVKVIEAGSAVGGTWYWNRYPGARFDSESYSYAYSWCPEVRSSVLAYL